METALYRPVKAFLEQAGYAVKGEIAGCDVVGLREGEPPVVVVCELKLTFNLELILQAVDRASVADEVWIAARISARISARGRGREADKRYRDLCRRLGIGMLGISEAGHVDVLVSAVSPMPRSNPKRRTRLLREHRGRSGDPALGGSTKVPILTAYRQQALALAAALATGPLRPRDLTPLAATAGQILRSNHYGWFERIDRGLYGLTAEGRRSLEQWTQA